MKRYTATLIVFLILIGAVRGWAQGTALNASIDACPGGHAVGIPEPTVAPDSLATLVRASKLIIVGTVDRTLLAVSPNSAHPASIETDSVVSVDQILFGSLPPKTSAIALLQYGGNVPPCQLSVPDDPLVVPGEKYLLFLQPDNRTQPPNTTGVPRFAAVGIWSGKVKIVQGGIQFSAAAKARLHQYDSATVQQFTAAINALTHPTPTPSPTNPPPLPYPPPMFPQPKQ